MNKVKAKEYTLRLVKARKEKDFDALAPDPVDLDELMQSSGKSKGDDWEDWGFGGDAA